MATELPPDCVWLKPTGQISPWRAMPVYFHEPVSGCYVLVCLGRQSDEGLICPASVLMCLIGMSAAARSQALSRFFAFCPSQDTMPLDPPVSDSQAPRHPVSDSQGSGEALADSAPRPQATLGQQLSARVLFYPTLAWNMFLARVLKVRHWWDRIDPLVIVGAYPFARDVQAMYDQGVKAVVNTCSEYAGPQAEYDRLGIEQLRIPTTDFTHPALADVQAAVEFVQHHVQQQHVVYIHCKAGRARSATVALCWLVKYRNMTPAQAQQQLLRHRPHVNPRVDQRPVVIAFTQQLGHS